MEIDEQISAETKALAGAVKKALDEQRSAIEIQRKEFLDALSDHKAGGGRDLGVLSDVLAMLKRHGDLIAKNDGDRQVIKGFVDAVRELPPPSIEVRVPETELPAPIVNIDFETLGKALEAIADSLRAVSEQNAAVEQGLERIAEVMADVKTAIIAADKTSAAMLSYLKTSRTAKYTIEHEGGSRSTVTRN